LGGWRSVVLRSADARYPSHLTAARTASSTPRKVDFDERARFGFKDADAAYQFRAEAERIAPDVVVPPDAEWQR
jgi:hypothetical protein